MADFQPFVPHGIIKLYRFVPLDESYQNTLHFKTRKQQLEYFDCLPSSSEITFPKANCKASFNGQSFTRNERQYIKIEGNACNYYDCNYMAYQNEEFGEMWFFAFIHTVEYVNDYCTEIAFEIDVMQSFMWNYELRECHVLREHSLTDHVGDSLTPEQIPNVPYKNTFFDTSPFFTDYSVVLITSCELSDISDWEKKPAFNVVGGLPFGGAVAVFDALDISTIKDTLEDIATNGSIDAVVTAYLFPKSLITNNFRLLQMNKLSVENNSQIDGYSPANNKLFTYPYTVIKIDTGDNEGVFKQELFYGNEISFSIRGVLGVVPQILITPLNYDSPQTGETDIFRTVTMDNFPIVQLSGNNFRNWFGQNAFKIGASTAMGIGEMVVGSATTVAAGEQDPKAAATGMQTAISGAKTLMSTAGDVISASHTPPTTRTSGTSYGRFASHTANIAREILQPTNEGAKIIDDIFTMFGYATNRVKVPNVRDYDTCRPHFNYLQCSEMSFHWELFISEGKGTSVPQRYMSKILSIYQNGITFWKDPTEVGRYEQLKYQNRPQ